MSNKIVSLALISALTLGGAVSLSSAAFASNNAPVSQTSGSVLVLHAEDGTVILSDGQLYVVPASINLASFNDGEHVTASWQQVGDTRLVVGLTHAQ